MLSYHLLGLRNEVLASDFPTIILYTVLVSSVLATYARHGLPDLTNLTTLGDLSES